jgi:hypothetical protein
MTINVMWLGKSNKQLDDLKLIKEAVQPTNWRSARMCNRDLNGDVTVDFIHEYRAWGMNKLGQARIVYEREVGDMARHLGELHFIPLALYKIMGDLSDQLGEFGNVTIWKLGRTVCVYSMIQRREKEKDSRYTGGISPCSRDRVSDL